MKTMNYLLTLVFVFLIGACTNEDQSIEEELATTDFRGRVSQEREGNPKILELELNKYFVINHLGKLDFEKRRLEELVAEGQKDLIPELEATMKSFNRYEEQLISIQERLCQILDFLAESLAKKASGGDNDARQQLDKMDEALKECGLEVTYDYFEAAGFNFATLPKTKTVGGCKIPGRDFKACDVPLPGGEHTVLVDGRLESLIIMSEKGRIISQGELVGKSKEIDGLYEYAFVLPSSVGSKLTIEVSKKEASYKIPIEVSKGF